MNRIEKTNQAITHFVKGGNNSDTELLDKILHNKFRVANSEFMKANGVTIIDQQKYLANIKAGFYGELTRKMLI